MIRTFPRLSLYLSIFVIAFAASTSMLKTGANHSIQYLTQKQTLPADAAFRDGLYLGKLDAKSGRTQHVSVGRWNSAEDRASFTAGYQQSYRDVQMAARETPVP